jgi:hypothetical protein
VSGGTRLTSNSLHHGPAIITAGCSFTFGHGIADQDTWPWLLQERLPQYRIINAGVMGYGTDQALMAAEREVRQNAGHTAAVVLGFAAFQIERNRATQQWLATVYPFSKPLFALTADGAIYSRQARLWSSGTLAAHSDLIAHILNASASRFYGVLSYRDARELTAAIITSFAARFRALGIRLAVVALPYPGDETADNRQDREFVVQRLRASRIPLLEPDFPRRSDGSINGFHLTVSSADGHPNGCYNGLLTSQIEGFLEANHILAEAPPVFAQ